jgi:hypothetical protein
MFVFSNAFFIAVQLHHDDIIHHCLYMLSTASACISNATVVVRQSIIKSYIFYLNVMDANLFSTPSISLIIYCAVLRGPVLDRSTALI